jgi:hypothetical protein
VLVAWPPHAASVPTIATAAAAITARDFINATPHPLDDFLADFH